MWTTYRGVSAVFRGALFAPLRCISSDIGRAADSGRWQAAGGSIGRRRRLHETRTRPRLERPSHSGPRNPDARQRFSTERSTPPSSQAPPSFAFAFDIDGVLLHVAKPIPGAAETLAYLHAHAIPFILLTNGGGKHEAERAADLSAKLGVPLSPANIVQSHTPFQRLAAQLRDEPVLVTGSDAARARAVAEAYGFREVVTPADLLLASPDLWPFDPLLESHYRATARPLPRPLLTPGSGLRDAQALRIGAVFVFNDPRDWALDIQLIVDLLLSREGLLGTYSARNGPPGGWQADGQPALYFSNADLFWAAEYHLPRLGQGAFQAAVAGVWERVTGGRAALRRTVIGKPYHETYAFAEGVLARHRASVLGGGEVGGLKRVYMVGDNPESDIAGANGFRSPRGTDWTSVLVRTGVWHPDRGEMGHKPEVVVDDVKEAVRWALGREGWRGGAAL